MADIVGSGEGTVGGYRHASVWPRVEWFGVVGVFPVEDETIPTELVPVSFTRTAWNNSLGDVQVQVAADEEFTEIVFDSTSVNVPGDGVTERVVNATGPIDGEVFWWRIRPVYPGTYQPDWTGPWSFSVNLLSGFAGEYVESNVGVEVTPESLAEGYVYANVGILQALYSGTWNYLDENVGVAITLQPVGHDYVHEGDVDNSIPTPHIWFLRPTAGRPFDGIDIIGFGFGNLQAEYGAIPQIDKSVNEWHALPIADWQAYLPTSAAYTMERIIDRLTSEIDPQHQIISIIIPVDARPPGHPVRVKIEEN